MESSRPQEAGGQDGLPTQSHLGAEASDGGSQVYDYLAENGEAILHRLIEENSPGTTPHEMAKELLERLAAGIVPDDYFI